MVTTFVVTIYVTSESEKQSFERDSKRLNISHGAERVRYKACTVYVTEELRLQRMILIDVSTTGIEPVTLAL